MFSQICTPALIYLLFGLTHVFMAIFGQKFGIAIKEFLMTLLFTIALNYLCENDLGLISWLFLFIPFILMTVFVIILLSNSIDPRNGKVIDRKDQNKYAPNSDIVLYHDHGVEYDHFKHGLGIRNKHEIAQSIDEKRNYKYELDKNTSYGGDLEMRHVRDQRLSGY